jgi:hypothetical protein
MTKMGRLLSFFLLISFIHAQTNPASLAARQFRESHERAIIDEYFQLLSIPNIATDQVNIRRNADFIVAMLKKRGVNSRLVEAPDANPVVFGEIRTPGATRTIALRRPTARSKGMGIASVLARASEGRCHRLPARVQIRPGIKDLRPIRVR